MRTVRLLDGAAVPALGLGTWRIGESARTRRAEIAAVRRALEIGYRLIDTAEMYGEGGAEEVIGAALTDAIAAGELRREEVFIVSKVYPHNASRAGVPAACERSLRRLGLGWIDLYLLHWRGSVPLAETVAAFEALKERGLIRRWGVSNFDVDDLQALVRLKNGAHCAANQIYYSVAQRGAEFALLPWQRAHRMPAMAYSPIDQGAAARDETLAAIGARHGASAAQIALAWVLRQPDVIAIPKAVRQAHLRENWAAASIALTPQDLADIDRGFPPPTRKTPLAMT
ncbi:MAG: aldo/keto reductase [Burkholderiaceae bacterium]